MAISLREFTDINPPLFQDKAAPEDATMQDMTMAPTPYTLPDNVGKSGGEYLKAVGPAIEAERKAQTEKDIFASEVKANEFVGKAKIGERMAEAYKTEKSAIEGSPEFSNLRKLEDELGLKDYRYMVLERSTGFNVLERNRDGYNPKPINTEKE